MIKSDHQDVIFMTSTGNAQVPLSISLFPLFLYTSCTMVLHNLIFKTRAELLNRLSLISSQKINFKFSVKYIYEVWRRTRILAPLWATEQLINILTFKIYQISVQIPNTSPTNITLLDYLVVISLIFFGSWFVLFVVFLFVCSLRFKPGVLKIFSLPTIFCKCCDLSSLRK